MKLGHWPVPRTAGTCHSRNRWSQADRCIETRRRSFPCTGHCSDTAKKNTGQSACSCDHSNRGCRDSGTWNRTGSDRERRCRTGGACTGRSAGRWRHSSHPDTRTGMSSMTYSCRWRRCRTCHQNMGRNVDRCSRSSLPCIYTWQVQVRRQLSSRHFDIGRFLSDIVVRMRRRRRAFCYHTDTTRDSGRSRPSFDRRGRDTCILVEMNSPRTDHQHMQWPNTLAGQEHGTWECITHQKYADNKQTK